MRISFAFTIDFDRERPQDQPVRESQLDALVEHSIDPPDAPRIGFRSTVEES